MLPSSSQQIRFICSATPCMRRNPSSTLQSKAIRATQSQSLLPISICIVPLMHSFLPGPERLGQATRQPASATSILTRWRRGTTAFSAPTVRIPTIPGRIRSHGLPSGGPFRRRSRRCWLGFDSIGSTVGLGRCRRRGRWWSRDGGRWRWGRRLLDFFEVGGWGPARSGVI